jgi:hypothetical protein
MKSFVNFRSLNLPTRCKVGKIKHRTLRILSIISTTFILLFALVLTYQHNSAATITELEPLSKSPNPYPESAQSLVLPEFLDIQVDGLENLEPKVFYNIHHNEFLVVWYTKQGGLTWDIWARRVGVDGNLGNPFNVVSIEAIHLTQPQVAYSPVQDEYLVVYTFEVSSSNTDIYGTMFKWDGSLIGAPFPIITEADKQVKPVLAYNSSDDEYYYYCILKVLQKESG